MKRILLAGFCWVFMGSISPAHAAEPQPGDACSNAGETMHAGGPEEIDGQMMVCDGANWKAVLEWDDATGQSLFQVDNDAGSCTATKTGRMRYDDGGDTWEYCDGSNWVAFPSTTGATACTDDATAECLLEATRANDDPEFTASNIACGQSILGITGTYDGNTNGLVGHWKLDESGNTSTAVDSAGSNDGTLTNFPADPSANWVSGKLGNALDFDGSDDVVDLGAVDVSGSAITLSAWFYSTSHAADKPFIVKTTGTSAATHYWSLETGGTNSRARVKLKTGGSVTTLQSDTGTVTENEWNYLVTTYDGSDIRIYHNAIEVASTTATGTVDTNGTVDAAIGNQPPSATGNRAYDGLIDDVRIYNRALSATEISDMYNGGAGCE